MALTEVQRGVIGQTEAAKIYMIRTNGEVECDYPASDDEHRDMEAHRRRHFAAIAIQVKTTWRFWTHRRSQILQIPFTVRVGRLVSDPQFYYFFGYFDKKAMAFRDPVFLVPSTLVHKHAMPRVVRGRWHFTFQASLKPGAHDRWSPYRVSTSDVGKLLLRLIRTFEKQDADDRRGRLSSRLLEGAVWLTLRRRSRVRAKAA
jgi:hypothetical protein